MVVKNTCVRMMIIPKLTVVAHPGVAYCGWKSLRKRTVEIVTVPNDTKKIVKSSMRTKIASAYTEIQIGRASCRERV